MREIEFTKPRIEEKEFSKVIEALYEKTLRLYYKL